jgi:hypothetical protein
MTSLGTIEYLDLPHRPNRTSLGYETNDARLSHLPRARLVSLTRARDQSMLPLPRCVSPVPRCLVSRSVSRTASGASVRRAMPPRAITGVSPRLRDASSSPLRLCVVRIARAAYGTKGEPLRVALAAPATSRLPALTTGLRGTGTAISFPHGFVTALTGGTPRMLWTP